MTPLHVAPALVLFATWPRRWSFSGLVMGSIIPDIEVPILYLSGLETQTGHGALHSIMGALTIDVLLGVVAVYSVFPALAGLWEGRLGSNWIYFAGVDVGNVEKLPTVTYSVLAGVTMHISIDFLTHATMPYLWPYSGPVETMAIGREWWWLAIVNAVLAVAIFQLLRRNLGKMAGERLKTAG